jgi:hypothetical protein
MTGERDLLPLARTPVVNGPVIHPRDCLQEYSLRSSDCPGRGVGLGNAILGGPAAPLAAWWMWVAVTAGDW